MQEPLPSQTETPGPMQPATLAILQQRPLHIPTLSPGQACPVAPVRRVVSSFGIAIGDGPVYADIGLEQPSQHPILYFVNAQYFMNSQGHGWGRAKIIRPEVLSITAISSHEADNSTDHI